MELKITQCQVGKFNWADQSKESLSFYMGIYEEGKIIEVGKIKAQLYYNGDKDNLSIFEDAYNRMDEVIDLCYQNSHGWISSNDYVGNTVLFAKLYTENIESLDAAIVSKETARIDKEIESLLKEKLSISNGLLVDISETLNYCIDREAKQYKTWLTMAQIELTELKEGTDTYIKTQERIAKYETKIASLEATKINIENPS